MIIYCNGDSFVAGSELADYTLPNHPGYFSDLPPAREKSIQDGVLAWLKNVKFTVKNPQLRELEEHCLSLAFPNKIQKILGCKFINAAVNGHSMDGITRTTITSLSRLLAEKNTDIVAILSTTEMNRLELPVRPGYEKFLWYNCSTGYDMPHQQSDYPHVIKYMVTHDTDYHQYMRFYKNVILIQDFCKVNSIKLYWVKGLPHEGLGAHQTLGSFLEKPSTPKDLEVLVTYADLKYDIGMKKSSSRLATKNIYCPQGHFIEEVHAVAAGELCDLILKEHRCIT